MAVKVYTSGAWRGLAGAKIYHNGEWITMQGVDRIMARSRYRYLGDVSDDEHISGATMTISSGKILLNPTIESARITVVSGGSIISGQGGVPGNSYYDYLIISNGGIIQDFYANYYDYERFVVYSGGTANRVRTNGYMIVSSGGFANSTTVGGFNAALRVHRGGSAANTTIRSGGSILAYQGGTATGLTINNSGHAEVGSSSFMGSITVNYSGMCSAASGGTMTDVTVNSAGYLIVSSGGTATNVTSKAGAIISVEDGGTITYA